MNDLRRLLHALVDPLSARELASSSTRRQQRIRTLAERERVMPVLGARLIESGAFMRLPETMIDVLGEHGAPAELGPAAVLAYQINERRTVDFRHQLEAISEVLRSHSLVWVPLKGAAVLSDGLWPDPAERAMTDLDLLFFDERTLESAERLLIEELGYRRPPADTLPLASPLGDRHQLPALVLPGHVGSVELHRALMPDEFSSHLRAVATSPRGAGPKQALAPAAFVRHVIAHAMISDWGMRTFRVSVRAVLDVAFVLRGHPAVRDEVRAAPRTRLLTAAIDAHLGLVDVILPREERARRRPLRARLWVSIAGAVASSPRGRAMVRYATMLPVFLRRDRMQGRVGGGGISRVAYAAVALEATWARTREAAHQIVSGREP